MTILRRLALPVFAIVIGLAIGASVAYANNPNVAQIPGFHCSAQAYTPVKDSLGGFPGVQGEAHVSCLGGEYNYVKSVSMRVQILGADGVTWFTWCAASDSNDTSNPALAGCSKGTLTGTHKFRVYVLTATVTHDGSQGGVSDTPISDTVTLSGA